MTLKELAGVQAAFDEKHGGKFPWDCKVTDDNIELLEFLIVSLAGELGETANIVKKIVRGDFTLLEKKEEISEEMADIFAYLLKLSYQMDIDLERAYVQKMQKNQERFQNYEKENTRKTAN